MKTYELIILGGGPAGAAAGVYAARKKLKSLIITETFGGQSSDSIDVQNWIGIVSIPGAELGERLKKHLEAYAADSLDIEEGQRVEKVSQLKKADEEGGPLFEVETQKGDKFQSKGIIFGLGSRRKKLKVEGADKLDHKGIVYCTSCDAPLFRDKDVAVIGGGNAGFEAAEQLISYANNIHLLEFSSEFKADETTKERVLKDPKVKAYTNAETLEIKGDKFVSGLAWKDRQSGETHELPVQGVFVEIGSLPNTEMLKGLVDMNEYGEIIIDHKTARTSVDGIWAAGDAVNQPYKQNNISMGDAVKALEDAYLYLKSKG